MSAADVKVSLPLIVPHLVLCRNLIHWQRYKRAVDAAWTVGLATTIEQSYPLGGSSPCR